MQDIIKAIKEDTKFNKSDLEQAQRKACDRVEHFIALQGVFPMILEELNMKLSEGYLISPMHAFNNQRAGYISLALRKPDALIKAEETAARAQAKQNYTESLQRRREALIADYVETVMAEQRQAEIDKLKEEEAAKSKAIKEQLLAGLS